jgi:hypothetical protein
MTLREAQFMQDLTRSERDMLMGIVSWGLGFGYPDSRLFAKKTMGATLNSGSDGLKRMFNFASAADLR